LLMLLIFWVSRRPKGDREREREIAREREKERACLSGMVFPDEIDASERERERLFSNRIP